MTFQFAPQLKLRRGLRFLALLLLLFAWSSAQIHAEKWVKGLSITVTVKDQAGNPLLNAQITITRGEKDNSGHVYDPVKDFTHDEQGQYKSTDSNLAFQLSGKAHQLTVEVKNLGKNNIDITDEMLRAAYQGNRQLDLGTITISKEDVPGKLSFNIAVTTDEGKKSVPNAQFQILRKEKENESWTEIFRQQTDEHGKAKIRAALDSTDTSYKLHVTAPGFIDFEKELQDADIKAANSNQYKVNLDPSPSFFKNIAYLANYIIWALGLMFLLLIIIVAIVWIIRRKKLKSKGSSVNPIPRNTSVDTYIQGILNTLNDLNNKVVTKAELKTELSKAVAEIKNAPPNTMPGDVKPEIEQPATKPSSDFVKTEESPAQLTKARDGHSTSATNFAGVQNAYLNLISRIPSTPEPIYMDVEEPQSIAGKLKDATTYLSVVPHSQGAFVLFTDDGQSGWVYPNPTINLRPAAVRDVFPQLTENEFAAVKENIRPKPVKKVAEKRWRVS